MDGQLRDKVASGVAWSMAEKVGTMLLQLAVSLTILRLLNPAIMGVICLLYTSVACRINEDYRDKPTPLFVGVLNGSFMFMSDLIKKIEFNNELSFVKLASYEGTCSTGCVKNLIGLNNSIEGRHVIIVEDIVDTDVYKRQVPKAPAAPKASPAAKEASAGVPTAPDAGATPAVSAAETPKAE